MDGLIYGKFGWKKPKGCFQFEKKFKLNLDKFKSSLSRNALSQVEIGPVILDKKSKMWKKTTTTTMTDKGQISIRKLTNKYELLTKPLDKKLPFFFPTRRT